MKTICAVFRNPRPVGRLRLIVLLMALALVGINQAPRAVAARSAAQSAVVTPITTVPMLTGTLVAVNNGPGNQTNPHVNCDRVSYTNDDLEGSSTIHYFDFSSGMDNVIPGNYLDRLSAVFSGRIAFTELTGFGDQVVLFDT